MAYQLIDNSNLVFFDGVQNIEDMEYIQGDVESRLLTIFSQADVDNLELRWITKHEF